MDAVRDGRHLMEQEDSGRPRIAFNPKHFTLWLDPNEPWELVPMTELQRAVNREVSERIERELPSIPHPNYRYQQRTGEESI